jgi:hypothetical protein
MVSTCVQIKEPAGREPHFIATLWIGFVVDFNAENPSALSPMTVGAICAKLESWIRLSENHVKQIGEKIRARTRLCCQGAFRSRTLAV